MLVTREEAKEKWCPMARHLDRNTGAAENSRAVCHAAACMMWRWADPPGANTDEEDARRGYCGLAGGLAADFAAWDAMAEPRAVELAHSHDDYKNRATYILAKALAASGVKPGRNHGAIAVAEEPIGLLASEGQATKHKDGTVVLALGVEARVVNHMGEGLIPLRSSQVGMGGSEEEALEQAAAEWIEGCLPPLRRALDETGTAQSDTSFHHFLTGEEGQQLFNVYNGPLFISGMEEQSLPHYFKKNPYAWLAERESLSYADAPLHLVKIYASCQPDGKVICDCTVDGEPFDTANQVMAKFDWPNTGAFRSVRWYSVLRQLPV